jgi:hypothetical protein
MLVGRCSWELSGRKLQRMFFVPETDVVTWGAGLPGSPILGDEDTLDRLTLFLIPIAKWSDGTAAHADER